MSGVQWGKERYEDVEVVITLRRKGETKRIARLVVSERRHAEVLKKIVKSIGEKM